MEKREAPWGLRPGEERGALIDAWRVERGISRHAALLLLLDLGLERGGGAEKNSKGGPAAAEKAVRGKKLPIVRGSDPKLVTPDVPVAGGKMAEVRRDTFPSWMRGKK